MEFVSASSEVILVTTPEPSSLTDSYSLLKVLSCRNNFDRVNTTIKVVANKASSREEGESVFNRLRTVSDQFLNINMSFLGIVPKDAALEKAVMQQVPVSISSPDSKSARSFEELATSIINNATYNERNNSGMARMIAKLFNRF